MDKQIIVNNSLVGVRKGIWQYNNTKMLHLSFPGSRINQLTQHTSKAAFKPLSLSTSIPFHQCDARKKPSRSQNNGEKSHIQMG